MDVRNGGARQVKGANGPHQPSRKKKTSNQATSWQKGEKKKKRRDDVKNRKARCP